MDAREVLKLIDERIAYKEKIREGCYHDIIELESFKRTIVEAIENSPTYSPLE
jgi:hypothetical protein